MVENDEPWAGLGFAEDAAPYDSPSQNARVLTESWVGRSLFCPNCGEARLGQFANNRPVADFECANCREQYELKSQKGKFGPRVVDGAYTSMLARLAANDNPNLPLMNYDLPGRAVTDLFVVPKQFFIPAIIEERKPLGPLARRAGWVGCNIRLDQVPASGKVHLIRGGVLEPKDVVLEAWRRTCFLRDARIEARGWLIEVMKCVEDLGRPEFRLAEVYAFEDRLAALYPGNRHVRQKIRQQLQVLRDKGFLHFVSPGVYRLASPAVA